MKNTVRAGAASVALFLAAGTLQATDFRMVSLRSDGTPPPAGYSDAGDQPAITPDGRFVVFVATADDLVTPNATGGFRQVYLRDRTAGTTEIVSVNNAGASGSNTSSAPSISDDGCRIVFMSFATNLVAGDANGTEDVFIRNRCAQPATTALASVSSGGAQANGQSQDGRISGDGVHVVFISYSTNLAAVPSASNCLFRRNLNTGVTSAVTAPNGSCTLAASPDLSRDGGRVAFWAYLEPGLSTARNGVWQIYVHDFASGQFVIASSDTAGNPQSQGSEGISTITAPAISSDGGYVAFRSRGDGLVARASGGFSQVYVKELATGTTVRVSVDAADNPGNADSSGSGSGLRPGLARLAASVTFLTNATNLAAETGGFFPNVVAHNPYTRQTVGFTSSRTLNGPPAMSDGGDYLVAASGFALDPAFTVRGMFVFGSGTSIARLSGISTRIGVLTGDNVMIAGFIIGGGTAKTVVVRARGPSLGVAGALANPTLTLVPADGSPGTVNDDWQTAANAAALAATGFQPGHANESAIMATLNPGAYTAIVSGVGGSTGVAIAEVYELDRPDAPMTGISTRGSVGTGDNVMIGGLVIQGSTPKRVVIRARGPSLGVAGALANPTLTLVPADGSPATVNDDWQTAANAAELLASGFQPGHASESAILITLNPGAYTAIVSGAGGSTGVAIVEFYSM